MTMIAVLFLWLMAILPVSILARVTVIPNVLKTNVIPDDEEYDYAILEEATVPKLPSRFLHPSFGTGPRVVRLAEPPKKCGKSLLSSNFVLDLKEKAGILPVLDVKESSGIEVQTTVVSSTTKRHTDHFAGNVPVPRQEPVAFVTTNTNRDAYFDAESTCIPIVRGNLVYFDGDSVHNTVVNSGTVRLLGPFHVPTMKDVKMVEPLLSGIVLGYAGSGTVAPFSARVANVGNPGSSTRPVSLSGGGISRCLDETNCLDDEACADLFGNGCHDNSGMCVRILDSKEKVEVGVVFDACTSGKKKYNGFGGRDLITDTSSEMSLETELNGGTVETYYHAFHLAKTLTRPNPDKIDSLAIHRWLKTGEQPWHRSTSEHYRLVLQAIEYFGGELIEDTSSPRVLDAGCGFGAGLMWLEKAKPDWDLVGYTLSMEEKNFIDKEILPSHKFEVSHRNYDDPVGKFDFIYSIESLFYSPDYLNTLRIWSEALNPGGLIVLIDDFPLPAFDIDGEAESLLLKSWRLEALAEFEGHLEDLPAFGHLVGLEFVQDRHLGEEYNIIENNYGNFPLPIDVIRSTEEPWLKGSAARYHLTVERKISYRMLVLQKPVGGGGTKSTASSVAHGGGMVWVLMVAGSLAVIWALAY